MSIDDYKDAIRDKLITAGETEALADQIAWLSVYSATILEKRGGPTITETLAELLELA